jgi:uncharacterized protein involved in exopolysaccharide biosynthesis
MTFLKLTLKLFKTDTVYRNISLFFLFILSINILLYEKTYTLRSSINPVSTDSANALLGNSGLSSLLGGSISSNIDITDVMLSNHILSTVFELRWFGNDNSEQDVFKFFNIEYENNQDEIAQARIDVIKELQSSLSISPNRRTGLISITYESEDLIFAKLFMQTIQENAVSYVNELEANLARTKTNFLTLRLEQVKNKLLFAEDNLKDFMEKNKSYSSPELQIEYTRKVREVNIQNELLLTLTSQAELSIVNQYDDVPTVVIIDSPYITKISSLFYQIFITIFFYILSLVFIYFFKKFFNSDYFS